MLKTFGSLFSCGGGVDIAAHRAGLITNFACEIEPRFRKLYLDNLPEPDYFPHDINKSSVKSYGYVDLLHLSPPCNSFSEMNIKRGEKKEDLELANTCSEVIHFTRPKFVTFENVRSYRNSHSWGILKGGLEASGYHVQSVVLNMADYGVPQDRKRFIAIASRDTEQNIFDLVEKEKVVSWYDAIADLYGNLKGTCLTPRQITLLSESKPKGEFPLLIRKACIRNILSPRTIKQPCVTLTMRQGQSQSPFTIIVNESEFLSVNLDCLKRFATIPDNYDGTPTSLRHFAGLCVPPKFYSKIIQAINQTYVNIA